MRFNPRNPDEDGWKEQDIWTSAGDQNWIDAGSSELAALGASPWETEVGPFHWCPPDPGTAQRGDGHFCLLARVVCHEDPIMHEGSRGYDNNIAQRNLIVVPGVVGGECSCPIELCGGSLVDVNIDSGQLIQDGGKVYFRIQTRLLQDASNVQGLSVVETTPGGQITTLECSVPNAAIQGIYMEAGQTSQAGLRARLPASAEDGAVYPVVVGQKVDGRHVGSVTLAVRIAGEPAFIGNWNSGELHLANCRWVGRMAPRHKVPFYDLEVAHRRRYDNCAFCLGGSKR
jgi:hypothetical protein